MVVDDNESEQFSTLLVNEISCCSFQMFDVFDMFDNLDMFVMFDTFDMFDMSNILLECMHAALYQDIYWLVNGSVIWSVCNGLLLHHYPCGNVQ